MEIDLNHINDFLFDLDDTLISTHRIFVDQMRKNANYVASLDDSSNEEDVMNYLWKLVDCAYSTVIVNPSKLWKEVLDGLDKEYHLSTEARHKIQKNIDDIYSAVPELLDGSLELLDHIVSKSKGLGLVTHAERDWTIYKLESTGLIKYFSNIYLVDVNEFKGKQHWRNAARLFGFHKQTCCTVGDSLKGDIIPTYQEGFHTQVYLDSGSGWSVYNVDDVPIEVIRVASPKEMLMMIK